MIPDSERYQKMTAQIDKYWDKLFADPITVDTPAGQVTIQPQRTNNLVKRFFRDIKRTSRTTIPRALKRLANYFFE